MYDYKFSDYIELYKNLNGEDWITLYEENTQRNWENDIFTFCALALGIFIYYLYKLQILIKKDLLSSFIRNYLPDILWMISFYSISVIFSKEITKNYIIFTALYVNIIGILFELLQLTGIVGGTFDIFDIVAYAISSIIAILIEKYYWRDKK